MNAQQVVNSLLEDGPDYFDPETYAQTTADPSARLVRALRDELVERGWRRIRIEKDDDAYLLDAAWIDGEWRAEQENAGRQVTGSPPREWNLEGCLLSSFRGALKRLNMKLLSLCLEDLRPAHEGIDLHRLPDDFEADAGDWTVQISFRFRPRAKFWSKLSRATSPD